MAEPSLQLGNGNWAGKSGNLLAYHKANNNFYADDLTFTRASTGTIVNADGLIEEVPYNLLQQSNSFDTTWLSNGTTETSGQSGYDGTNNAWLLKKNTSGSRYIEQSLSLSSAQYSCSVYLKAESTNWVLIWSYDGSTGVQAYFDLENGVVGDAGGSNLDSTNIESVGNGWYRCTLTYTRPTTLVRIYPADANGSVSPTDDNGIYIQDAQLNSGATAKPYFPTTTRLNVPRVDYLNNPNGSLLLEPQRTNFITQSSNLSLLSKVAVGTASPPVTTANYATSPDGTQNATRVVFDLNGGSDRSILRQAIPLGSDYYFSIYVKSTNGTDQKVMFHDGDEQNTYNVTNEWQRITYDGRSGISYAGIALTGNSGADTSDILVWGFQVEQGSYATSIINTSGAAVTRLADTSSTTGLSDVIGQTEGTMFVEIELASASEQILIITSAAGNEVNRLQIYIDSSRKIGLYRGDASVSILSSSAYSLNSVLKIAAVYKSNDYALYINGVSVGTDTSATIPPTPSLLYLGSYVDGSKSNSVIIKQAQLYKTRLTNAELATLTTL